MELNPLKLATTEELIKELTSRHDACLIVMLQCRPGIDHFFIEWKGLTACVGLAERAKARLIEECLLPSEEGKPSEED